MDVRRSTSNKDYCGVNGCIRSSNKNLSIRFHRFPRPNEHFVKKRNVFGNIEKVDLFSAWATALNMTNITKRTKVCSLHFKKSDYFFADYEARRRVLKKKSIPSRNLPLTRKMIDKVRMTTRAKPSDKSVKITRKPMEQIINDEYEIKPNIKVEPIEIEEEMEICNEQFLTDTFVKMENPESLVKDEEVQVNTHNPEISITHSINSKEHLNTMTGLESFEVLDIIVDLLKRKTSYRFEHNCMTMNTRERVILTYVKLKQNISFIFLAALFNCTTTYCQTIFYDTIKGLSKCLQRSIPWPTKDEISKNIPNCFEGLENVRIAVDCIKIYLQWPDNNCFYVRTFSDYRGPNTCKIMIGISPAGNITYISKVYKGGSSNSSIFRRSRLMQLLEPGDGVMVGRGFLIDKMCAVNKWTCIRPKLLKQGSEFTEQELLLTNKETRAWNHVERSSQKIKSFKIVGSAMSNILLPILKNIIIVICGSINVGTSIMTEQTV